jgi:hypothetical protein
MLYQVVVWEAEVPCQVQSSGSERPYEVVVEIEIDEGVDLLHREVICLCEGETRAMQDARRSREASRQGVRSVGHCDQLRHHNNNYPSSAAGAVVSAFGGQGDSVAAFADTAWVGWYLWDWEEQKEMCDPLASGLG